MESMLRRFGLKKGEPRETDARQKLQKELFAFNRCGEHGFPNKACSMAYSEPLGLLAIGTKTGALRVFGAPGVQFSAHHGDDVAVTQIFIFGQAQLITMCNDSTLHLWQIAMRDGLSELEHVQVLSLDPRIRTVSAFCLLVSNDRLLLGTEVGHVYVLDIARFKLDEKIISQEDIIHSVPDDFRVNPGPVEAIVQHPVSADKLLIGYNRGLIVLWDMRLNKADKTYNAAQQLECLTFHHSGKEFMSSHGNGSYIVWKTAEPVPQKDHAITPYGPFPCKSIAKIRWKTTKSREPIVAFSGGMPRASHGDRHSVTVMQGDHQVAFDFTSKIVDFDIICSSSGDASGCDNPQSLMVLAEEEVVFVDLVSDGWPTHQSPYLASLHSSAITCTTHVGNVPQTLWTKLIDAGLQQQAAGYSDMDWPIHGGTNLQNTVACHDLLITGHEDGSLRFWDVSSTNTLFVYKLTTANIFGTGFGQNDANEFDPDEEWPPFRKVGTFDPFSDDPRLAIQKIIMCPLSEILIVGGTAGQVVVFQFEREERRQEVRQISLNLIAERDNFVWKGHDALMSRGSVDVVRFAPGFQPLCIVQMHPPATCTALALHSEWQLLACGTAHGFGLVDYAQRRPITTKCTLNPADLTGVGESTMSRRKSFKKSLRESFRRLRSRRSERHRKTDGSREDDGRVNRPINSPRRTTDGSSAPPRQWQSGTDVEATRPVERQIEARSTEDSTGSIVRTLYFTDTFIINGQGHSPTLWAGTNAGSVFLYQITLPPNNDRRNSTSEPVSCLLAKEIHLKHHAPVIGVFVIDRNAVPLPGPLEVQHERAKNADMTGGHHVVICSEEQLKIFSLPSLSANNKFKLTAHEGAKLRKVGLVNFRSRSDGSYLESDLVCLTNLGEAQVFSIPQLRRQLKADCIKKDNIIGIVSSVFTQNGEGFYLSSPSEFSRFSVSAHVITRPRCVVGVDEASSNQSPSVKKTPSGNNTRSPLRSPVDSPNRSGTNDDSVMSGDITADSVRVHVSEEPAVGNVVVTRRVVTTTTTSRTNHEGTVTHTTTNTEQSTGVRSPRAVVDGVNRFASGGQ